MAKKKTTKKKSTKKKSGKKKTVTTITHSDERRTNIPTAEQQSVVSDQEKEVKKLKYPRNPDLDPQLVWRGKDEQDWSDLVVGAPPLYIQEKVHPKVLIDDLLKVQKSRTIGTTKLMVACNWICLATLTVCPMKLEAQSFISMMPTGPTA